jgi:hypothetical protein
MTSERNDATPGRRDVGPPSTGPSEKETLVGFLDYLRDSIVAKVEGVPEPQVRTAVVSSGTNLLGLVKHLTNVERFTFLGDHVRSWPATFRPRPNESAEDILRSYRETTAEVNDYLEECTDLTVSVNRGKEGRAPSVRWALTHMIEETGRHAGHADILRELIDGSTGR